MSKYKTIVGLEIHLQPKTKSKMFCSCNAAYFGAEGNTYVCPVCLGLPGALPVPNKIAIEKALQIALALNCKINLESKFDRKNYFYPDLPKGYQISQYDQPLGYDGYIDLQVNNKVRRVRITRVHMEEDTGKSIHGDKETMLDYNKSGLPLIEIVTEPDFDDKDLIDVFAKRMRQIIRYTRVSDADMEKGQLRYELNISLAEKTATELPNYKVEVKNIGSISLLQKVLESEVERHTKILNSGETPVQETRGTRDMSGKTYSQRVKEEANDYRYFPEPDIPPLLFTQDYIDELKSSLPKLPDQLLAEYAELGITGEVAETIVAEYERAGLFADFMQTAQTFGSSDKNLMPEIAKLIAGDLTVSQEDTGKDWSELIADKAQVIKVLELKLAKKLNSSSVKDLVKLIVAGKFASTDELDEYLAAEKLLIDDTAFDLDAMAKKFVDADPTARERFSKNPNMAMFFVGQIMREAKGAVNPQAAKEAVEKALRS